MSVLRISALTRRIPEFVWWGHSGLRTEVPGLRFRRLYSAAILRTEREKRKLVEQAQLVDVLEARIQQLRTDDFLDRKDSEVHVVNVSHVISKTRPPWNCHKPPRERPAHTEVHQLSQAQAHGSRWIEKLKQEKWKRSKRQQHLQQKIKDNTSKGEKNSIPKGKLGTINTAVSENEDSVSSAACQLDLGEDMVINNYVENLLREVEEQEISWDPLVSSENLVEDQEGIRQGNIQLNIRSYLEACLFNDDLNQSQKCLHYFHRKVSRRKHLTIDLYNVLMRAWAKKGALKPVGKLFILVEEAGLKPNLESYAAALECIGRSSGCSEKMVSRCLQQLQEDDFTLHQLFESCMFQGDEQEMVLKAVHMVVPDFQPPAHREFKISSCPLVQDLYTKRDSVTYPKLHFTLEELRNRFRQQVVKEQSGTITIDSVEASKPLCAHTIKMRGILQDLRAHWRKCLLEALRERKSQLASSRDRVWRMNLYPYLCLLEDDEYVDAMLQCIASLPPIGESLVTVAKELGSKIYNKHSVQKKVKIGMKEKMGDIYARYAKLLAKDTKPALLLPREKWELLEAEQRCGLSALSEDLPWPNNLVIQLGMQLVDLMVQELKLQTNIINPEQEGKLISVLYHMYTFRSNRQVGFIKPHPIFTEILQGAMETTLTFDSHVMPMLCPPVPWTSPKFGAYVLVPSKLMRCLEGAVQHQLLLEKCPSEDLHPVLDSLNQLGNCAWKINQPVLDIIISIFNDKGNDSLNIPPPISEAPEMPQFQPRDKACSQLEKVAFKRELSRCKKKMAEMHSLRVDALYKLSIANCMRDEIFWFPHNMDFRGRTYPCPPYFNHLGSDLTRAILLFAEGKPLGEHGLNWLKIHLVNLTGLKKRNSLPERLAYANEILEDILDSAINPLDGRKWWMAADEPWQVLACCMEIASAISSPDHRKYISHFPVHQDGSCNGLQHYAALGRDTIGATSVNLMPCDVPQDVYSSVAQQVEEFRRLDAMKGVKIAQVLEGFISRKVVKQTVMTVVYGVTRYGGRLQIEKRLKEIDEFPKEYVWDASHYLVHQVFNSLKEMFTGTREIQDWLTENARLIAKLGSTVQWVTPLGLPIVQPYHRTKSLVVKSNIQSLNLQVGHDVTQRPDTVKQKNAFPPNFIHSLDSTHMMLTALHCHSAGLTFVSVHDCFWTHAVTVDIMNRICREQFVALHSQPILEDLSKFLLEKYSRRVPDRKSKKFMEYKRLLKLLFRVPQTGDFDLQKVKDSTYFFS
ncbi:DNA-directed RNA polymerase, mitochondrial [Polypterus senegalus]|uniref:DNA-directed RNA polymerase, mitochondrial n=1 Tax=Polypterus senegalus TaxID=55291 RepID=UPI0019666271|nr:DNA-directed RNA polymerase, mitochondrial [Polypterus senegalus]